MNKLSLMLALLAASPVLGATEASLSGCRAVPEAGARLACYDALPLPTVAPSATAGLASAAARDPARPATAATTTAQAVASFGLEAAGEKLQEVRSHISGHFDGWRAGDRIRLANGQVWRVVNDSRADYSLRDPQVTVRRGALGSYLLDIEGAKQLPRVRRVE